MNSPARETTVRRLVKELREKEQEAFVPLAFPPGDALQIDWGEATCGGWVVQKTTVNLFCARLCYSGAPMVLAYRRQHEESFLEVLVQVFQYFGGVPKQVIFDNGKVAVKDGFGAHVRKQAGYAALSAHYGFEAVFCNPASGNEKGLVEGLVGYIRRNVCVPIPKTETMDTLNRMLLEKCSESYLFHQIRGKPASVGEMLVQEQGELYPLPGYPFDPCKRTSGRVDRFCTVRFDTNNYSVPAAYCATRGVCQGWARDGVDLLRRGSVVAQHQRCPGQTPSYLQAGTLPSTTGKRKAGQSSTPDHVQDTLPRNFLDWLQKQRLSPKELVELLRRCQEEGCDTIMTQSSCHAPSAQIQDTVVVQEVDLHLYDAFLRRKVGAAV